MNDKSVFKIASVAIAAIGFVVAIVSFFLLPEKIFVEVLGNSPVPETSTVSFLIIGFLLIAASGAMSIYIENGKKWIALQSVLCIAFIGCLAYNFIVL